MADNIITLDRFRTGKAYTLWQAAGLAGVDTRTARRWLLGSSGDAGLAKMEPLFGDKANQFVDEPVLTLSFLELVELVIVARFRKRSKRLKLERLRDAHRFAREQWGLPYPFASLNLLQLGGHLLHVYDEQHPAGPSESLALDMSGQPTLPGLVKDELEKNLEFPDTWAGVWHPRGAGVPVIVDPHIAAGRPVIEGTGVTVETVSRRWHEGETITLLARDYDLSIEVLDQVLHVADLAA